MITYNNSDGDDDDDDDDDDGDDDGDDGDEDEEEEEERIRMFDSPTWNVQLWGTIITSINGYKPTPCLFLSSSQYIPTSIVHKTSIQAWRL